MLYHRSTRLFSTYAFCLCLLRISTRCVTAFLALPSRFVAERYPNPSPAAVSPLQEDMPRTHEPIDDYGGVSLAGIREAAERISPHVHETPVLTCKTIDELSGGRQVFFKCELFQKTGSFKARGACNAALLAPPDCQNVVTHSSGNHAQVSAVSRSAGFDYSGQSLHLLVIGRFVSTSKYIFCFCTLIRDCEL